MRGVCFKMRVTASYSGAKANANLVPPSVLFTVVGKVEGLAPTAPNSVAYQLLEIKNTNVGMENSAGAEILEANPGTNFSEVLIEP